MHRLVVFICLFLIYFLVGRQHFGSATLIFKTFALIDPNESKELNALHLLFSCVTDANNDGLS